MMDDAKERLIVALDVASAKEARRLFAELREHAGMFKIGSQLFTAAGPAFVREITEAGGRVFLDLKFHDIPNTVAAASVEAARLGVSIFNVHALGGSEMMRRVAAVTTEVAEREGLLRPAVIAVTVLTSSDAATLAEIGMPAATTPQNVVARLAQLASESGMNGVVASGHEIKIVRQSVQGENFLQANFLIVTPGVRPASHNHDDQKRVVTPADAFRDGADYLVIGRAIIDASDPATAAEKILDEMRRARPNG